MSEFPEALADMIRHQPPPAADAPGGRKKNYTEAPELYEEMGIVLFDPEDPDSLNLAPENVPATLHADTYAKRLVGAFNRRNPFY